MLVYTVVENWSNGETYELAMDEMEIIAVCITKNFAQKLVKERKAELIEIAKNALSRKIKVQ